MKTEITKTLEKLLANIFNSRRDFYVFECTIGWCGHEIVDCISYNCNREIRCFEIKQSKSDFHSKNALTFIGNYNYFVMPFNLYEQIKDEISSDIGVYVSIDRTEFKERKTNFGTEHFAEYINGFNQLICVKNAKRRDLRADKEVILSSMLRSMQRDLLR